jgi:hypothetical protein
MMEKLNFRMLNADEIDCRVGTVTDKGVSLLMYKDARVDMRLLDEVVGPMNWKREHELINGNLFCTVSIRDEKGEWVSKQDVGVESNTEKEKGQASDAFKRACFNWGIGRELYTCPFVWINLSENEWRVGVGGKKQPRTRFYVKDIQYKDGKVTNLVIVDDAGRIRFSSGGKNSQDDDKFGAAILEIAAAENTEELKALYFKYEKNYKNDKRFINAVNQRKSELSKIA